jgi:hypothetical protein
MKQFIAILLLHFSILSIGQNTNKLLNYKNSVQLEILGNGILYSINYEHIFNEKSNNQFCYKLGISSIPFTLKPEIYSFGLISEVDLLIGIKEQFIEIGSGFTYWNNFEMNSRSTGFYIPRIGLRYKFINRKTFIRIGFTPLININTDSRINLTPKILPFGGITIGHSF